MIESSIFRNSSSFDPHRGVQSQRPGPHPLSTSLPPVRKFARRIPVIGCPSLEEATRTRHG
jgi:hypothetical protein